MTNAGASPRAARYEAVRVAALFYSDDQGMNDEADLSAEQSGARAPARFPVADGDSGRPQRDSRSPQSRPQEAVGVTTLTARRDFLAANAGKRAPMPGFVLLVRNRMKRRLRALARELLPESGVRGADHVLIGRGSGVERDFGVLRSELRKALAKVAR